MFPDLGIHSSCQVLWALFKIFTLPNTMVQSIHDLSLIYTPILISVLLSEIDNSNDYMESDEGITITVRFSGTLKDGTVQW